MAADSAVTVSNGNGIKIYNTATKIFRLSVEHPIGVMIYNDASFMGTPWEVIFKLFRKEQGSTARQTVKEYVEGFIDFIQSHNYFSNEENEMQYFTSELSTYYYRVMEQVNEKKEDDDEKSIRDMLLTAMNEIKQECREEGVCDSLSKYTAAEISSYGKQVFKDLTDLCEANQLPVDMTDQWIEGFYEYIRSRLFWKGTGLVFVGFGEKDIYPTLYPVYISGFFDRHFRYFHDEDNCEVISNHNSACVCPFGQKDVMITMMKGVAPSIYNLTIYQLRESIMQERMKTIDCLEKNGVPQKVIEQIANMDISDIENEFDEKITTFINEEYVNGIVDAVESFNIEDMTNMAESLVSMTNLQRHISSSEESVGGPIDVAVITRSEGFIWIKHKQWFSQQLNPQTRLLE